jgi:hypothetical protein
VYLADSIAGTVRTVRYIVWFVALGLAAGAVVWNRRREGAAVSIARPWGTATPRPPLPVLDDERMWR